MNIRTPELAIPDDDPFLKDALDRRELEPPLSQFVRSVDGPMVLAIDGGWGIGKTTFLRMWMRKLQTAGHACLYLNAWQSDFSEDPLAALIGELSELVSTFKTSGERQTALQERLETVKKVGGKIIKKALPALVRMGTAGLLNVGDLVEKEGPDLAAAIVEDQIDEYEKKKEQIGAFRKSLVDFISEFRNTADSSQAGTKVILIVDELDRCRPTYAVELLERVKHLFDVPGMIFVLGVDRGQLCHSVRGFYGAGFDAVGYLRRFVDFDYRLPEPEGGKYCKSLFGTFGLNDLRSKWPARDRDLDASGMCDFLSTLFDAAKLGLRTQQQIVARLWVVMQTIPKDEALFTHSLLLLVFLREWRQDFYDALASGRVSVDEVIIALNLAPQNVEISSRRQHDFIKGSLFTAIAELGLQDPHVELKAHSEEQKSEILGIANWLMSDLQSVKTAGFKINLERIAMTQPFELRDD